MPPKRESVYPFTNFKAPGATIHRFRSANNWTLQELSNKSGVSVSAISRIENNAAGWTRHSMEKIAGALGVEIERLFIPPELVNWYCLPKAERDEIARRCDAAARHIPPEANAMFA